jgi:hypothetical protein
MACSNDCKTVGEAKVGTTFIVGCAPCPVPPTFSSTARRGGGGGKPKSFTSKFERAGLR